MAVTLIQGAWRHCLLLFACVISQIDSQCSPVCEYNLSSPLAIDSGSTKSFAVTHHQANVRLRNNTAVSLFTTKEACSANTPAASCTLTNVVHANERSFSGDLTCSDLEGIRGEVVLFVLEMESLQNNGSSCVVLVESFVFKSTPTVTSFRVERSEEFDKLCIVTLEGCFPPCCGSDGRVTRILFGSSYRYRPDRIVPCTEISTSISAGDSSTIYDEKLPSSLEVQVQSNKLTVNLSVDIQNLQNCFKTCMKTIDIGLKLIALNYTRGCFSTNVTISPPEGLLNSEVHSPYKLELRYCKLKGEPFNLIFHIECIGFNPNDEHIKEKMIVEISHGGVCTDDFTINITDTVPCMDERCYNITAYDVEFCLTMCVDRVATESGMVQLCESVVKDALQYPLSSQNLAAILSILRVLANSSSSRQIEALNYLMEELLLQLEKQANFHLISELVGKKLLTTLDLALKNNPDRKVDLAAFVLTNIEKVMKVVARSLRVDVLSSNLEYAGSNTIVLARIEKIQTEEGYYVFPKQDVGISDVQMEIPMDLLCNQTPARNEGYKDCQTVVASVIIRDIPEYLGYGLSNGDNVVNSLLLTTLIDSTTDYRDHILHNPITIYFLPTPLVSDFSNETCVFWDPMRRTWSSAGIYTSDTVTSGGGTICVTTHLTSFAVLVNPESSNGQTALDVVSYIGCAISLACLLLSLLIFLVFGKSLNKGVLLNVHINFVISLSLALTLFVFGIETATKHTFVCKVIAALLHYLFLCVFCWMLAEGIMLYMLVVTVFGSAAEKWYYLLLLGWGFPLLVVTVSVGLRHDDYGTKKYCWLSDSKGIHWAFLGPMIVILLINTFILVATVRSMIKSRRKFVGTKDSKSWRLALTTIKTTVILLPLLGLTWIVGPFLLLKNTDMFSWSFAILNSLQGLFFFLLHVLRNEKVYGTIQKCFRCIPIERAQSGSLRNLASNINLSSAESVTTATTNEGVTQLDYDCVASPPFSTQMDQRKSSKGSTVSLGHSPVALLNH